MKSLVWEANKVMRIRDVEEPMPREGWVVLEVRRAGICGSDIAGFLGRNELRKPPLVMGHEFSGVVVRVGEKVPGDMEGELVTANPIMSCGVCQHCKRGQRQLCLNRKVIGIDFPGGFADNVVVPAKCCYAVTEEVGGALVEPLATAVRAARRSRVGVGDSVAVIGAGAIGLLIAKLLKTAGAGECIVVDTNPARLKSATSWGATLTVNPPTDDVQETVRSVVHDGIDCVIDAVGSDETRKHCISVVRRGGRVVLVGLHDETTSIPGNLVVRAEIEIAGSFAYTDDDFVRAVSLIEAKFLDFDGDWLSSRPLAEGQEAFLEQSVGAAAHAKVLLAPGK